MGSRDKRFLAVFLTLGLMSWAGPAMALSSWVIPVGEGYRYHISDIVYIGDREPVFTLDSQEGTISFGDGQLGERPPVGQGVIAAYRRGNGSTGNLYPITANFQPLLIPWQEFATDSQGRLDLSLIVAGLEKVDFQTGPNYGGVMVQEVGIVPLPGTLLLLGSGLLGILAASRKR